MRGVTFVFSGALAPENPHAWIQRDGSYKQLPTMFPYDEMTVVVECRKDEDPTAEQLKEMAKISSGAKVHYLGTICAYRPAIEAL